MEVDQANEAEAKGRAEPARTRNAAKKPDKARKQAGQIDSERLIGDPVSSKASQELIGKWEPVARLSV